MTGPAPGRVWERRPLQVLGACAVVGATAAVCALMLRHPWHHSFDLKVYRGAVRWWSEGQPLYDYTYDSSPYGFTYPPFAAVLMAPMAALSFRVVLVGQTLLDVAVLAALARGLVRPIVRRHGLPVPVVWIAAVPPALALVPVRETVGLGQVNLLLLGLVLADGAALRRGSRWAGVGIGLAAAVKLTPGLFVPYLLLTGRRRAATVATGTAVAATLLALAVSPETSRRYWTEALWQTDRVGRPDRPGNQSLLGGLARLADPGQPSRALWAVLVVVVLAVVLGRAVRAARTGDELAGLVLVGLAACLVSPISWTHHLVWVLPALVVLVDVAAGRAPAPGGAWWWRRRPRVLATVLGAATEVVFTVPVAWFAPSGAHPAAGAGGIAREDVYLIVVLVLALLLPARAGGEERRPLRASRGAARSPARARPGGWSPR